MRSIKHKYVYVLLLILVLFRAFPYVSLGTPIKFLRIWPDSKEYLSEINRVFIDPSYLLIAKSPVYLSWLTANRYLFGNDILYPLFFQNLLGIVSAIFLLYMLRNQGPFIAITTTFLVFFNPTTLALENAILRESIARFFVLAAFVCFWCAFRKLSPLLFVISGILFVVARLTRSELLVVYLALIAATILVSRFNLQRLKTMTLPFALPVVLIIVYGWVNPHSMRDPYHGHFNHALLGLKTAAYLYKSPTYPDLISNIAAKAKECKELYGQECERPSLRMFTFMETLDKEICKYLEERKTHEPDSPPITVSQMKDLIYLDIIKYNTMWFLYSAAENFFRYLTHEVQNTSIILYDGRDDSVVQNMRLYMAPGIVAPFEQIRPYYLCITAFFQLIDLNILRKILLPFFFVGFFVITRRFIKNSRRGIEIEYSPQDYLMFLILAVIVVHLLFLSVMSDPVARFIFPIDPLLFTVEIYGLWVIINIVITTPRLEPKIPVGIKQCLREVHSSEQHYSVVHISKVKRPITEWMVACSIVVILAAGLISLGMMPPRINGDFEYWSAGDFSPPGGWTYAQNGTGGWVRKVVGGDNVKVGMNSAEIKNSSVGGSQIYYTIYPSKEYQVRGSVIEVEGWVKSENKIPNKISIAITGSKPVYYQNSGNWERLTLSHMVPTNSNGLNIYCNVDSGADAVAYFDGVSLHIR